jgi:hypothetical protein
VFSVFVSLFTLCSAEDWDLAKPLQTCSLAVERRDDFCIINLFSRKLKKGGPKGATEDTLFALCHIDLEGGKKVSHFVESVADSSRYFVVRISDENTGRHATIGMGFRERDDASNFRVALQEYERSLQRERTAEAIHMAYEGETTDGDRKPSPLPEIRNLTLKEGEKLHIDLKGKSTTIVEKPANKLASSKGSGGALPLLKKPPPSPAIAPVQHAVVNEVGGINLDDAISEVDSSYCGSEGAVEGRLTDDEEWNDFEGSET